MTWDAGIPAGAWNAASNALMVNSDAAYSTILKVDSSNPSAPVALPMSCPFITSVCDGKQVNIPYSPAFSNSSKYLVYYMSADGKLSSADFTATYTNPSVAPVTKLLFDPYETGHCASGLVRPNGGTQVLVSKDDSHFMGFGNPIIWHTGDADCTLIQWGTGNWVASGAGQQGSSTGTFSWTDDQGNPTTSPGTGCKAHGLWYDSTTNTLLVTLQSGSCSGLDGQNHGVIANLSTLTAFVCSKQGCAGGHGLGQVVTIGSFSYVCNGATPFGNTSQEFCNSYATPSNAVSWFIYPTSPNGGPYPDNHMAGLWTAGFPYYVVTTTNDSTGGNGHNADVIPPVTTLPTLLQPYTQEIDLFVISAAGSPGTTRLYRFAHTYEASLDYNSGGRYGSLVGPALSPDKCWAAFPSNWFGHLGTIGNRANACTTSAECAYDVFAVYLCGGPAA